MTGLLSHQDDQPNLDDKFDNDDDDDVKDNDNDDEDLLVIVG